VRTAVEQVIEEPEYAAAATKIEDEIAALASPEQVARAVEEHAAHR
jgi:UDP:flavonoid glycosyltransferase YjiC (YdhE family)